MTLPFGELGWEQFEGFVAELVGLLPGVVEVSGYGPAGSKQRGIDLTSDDRDGTHRAYQCKKRASPFRERDVENVIADTDYVADAYTLVLSNVAPPRVRDRINDEPAWTVWDADDLSRLTRTLPIEHARRLVDRYFGAPWRKVFLGTAAGELFIAPQDAFAPFLDSKRLFNHTWPILGRESEIGELQAAVAADDVDCLLLVGRGGLGKSRLLWEISQRVVQEGTRVLFLSEQQVTPEAVDDLPLDPLVVIVDDAHKRDDLGPLFAALARRPMPATIVLGTRPQRVEELRGLAARTGYDPVRIRTVTLRDLSRADVEELARRALGPEMVAFAERLAAATRDSPLVTVVGARLLAERRVLPQALETDTGFRTVVLGRFEEEVVGDLGPAVDSATARKILRLIAAIGPVQVDDEQIAEAAAAFVATDRPTFSETVGRLESAGVLIRRGRRFRISPDTLSDHILREACLTDAGDPTGYADAVFAHFFALSPNQLLRNLAELDWRASAATQTDTGLLDRIWNQLHTAFAAASNRSRIELLSILRESAYYQPTELLKLVETAIKTPSATADPPHRFLPPSTHEEVLDTLPALLREIAYNAEHLDRTIQLLWLLGRDDTRPTNQYTDHPIRVIAEIAAYNELKPIAYNELVLEALEPLLAEPGAFAHDHSPVEVLEPLLAREGISSFARGHEIGMRRFTVPAARTAALRRRVRGRLEDLALSDDLGVAVRALRALTEALGEPHGAFGERPPKDERDRWLPEQLEILEQLDRVRAAAKDPLLYVNLVSDVRWHRERSSWPIVRKRVADLLAAIPDTSDFRLTGLLINQWDVEWLPDDSGSRFDVDRRMRELRKIEQAMANALLARHHRTRQLFAALNDRVRQLETTGARVSPYNLILEMADLDPEVGRCLGEEMLDQPDEPLARSFGAVVQGLRKQQPAAARQLVERALKTQHWGLAWSVAASLRGLEWAEGPDSSDLQSLQQLLLHHDSRVRTTAIDAIPYLAKAQPKLAKQLILTVDVNDDVRVAKELLGAFNPHVGFDYSHLTKADLRTLLRKIPGVDRIDDYEISRFLAHAAWRVPDDVVTLLLKRLRRAEARDDVRTSYLPIPYDAFHHTLDGLREAPTYKDNLRRIRQRAYRARRGMIHFWLPKLFALVSGLDRVALDVLDEWIADNDLKKVRAVGILLRDAPPNFVFAEPEFVAGLLEASKRIDDDLHEKVVSDLYGSAIQGIRQGSPGQPFPQDLTLRNSAKTMAQRFTARPAVRELYEALLEHANNSIERSLLDDEEFADDV